METIAPDSNKLSHAGQHLLRNHTHFRGLNVPDKPFLKCVITVSLSLTSGLQDNPWVCDCRLASLLDISKAPESSMALLDRFLTCSGPPGLAGVPFQSVELSRCRRPYVVTSGTKITALLGSNVLLRCDATGHPTPKLMWFKSARPSHYNTGILIYTYMWFKII